MSSHLSSKLWRWFYTWLHVSDVNLVGPGLIAYVTFILFFFSGQKFFNRNHVSSFAEKVASVHCKTTLHQTIMSLWFSLLLFFFFWCHRWFIPDKNIRCWSLTCLWALRSPVLLQWVCTVSWLRSYEFGQSEECEPSHGPQQASERESSLKFRPERRNESEEHCRWMAEYDTVRLLQGSHPLISRRTWKQLILLVLKQNLHWVIHLWNELCFFFFSIINF